jgi:hypothetical protein
MHLATCPGDTAFQKELTETFIAHANTVLAEIERALREHLARVIDYLRAAL